MTARLTVFLPFTTTTPAALHDAIDAAFLQAEHDVPMDVAPVPMTDAPILLRAPDVAQLLSLSETTVRDMTARGELPSFKINGARCYYRAKIVAWVEQQIADQNGGAR